MNPKTTLEEIGRVLGVDSLTVKRHAARLKLPFSAARKSLPEQVTLKSTDNATELTTKRDWHRSLWLQQMNKAPHPAMATLRKSLPRAYRWLIQHDREWLRQNKPAPPNRLTKILSVDWKQRDRKYSKKVEQTVADMRTKSGRPIRITKTAVARRLGVVSMFQKHLQKMPLTNEILSRLVETSDDLPVSRLRTRTEII
jgi:hypothetical protein